VRVLLWHGYLLRGTGSNIYKANIVREWRAAGHDVLLMCQEHDVQGLDFVDWQGAFAPGNDTYNVTSTGVAPGKGSVTLIRPVIGDVLPVYVVDHYDGFMAKQYLDLTPAELDEYVSRNRDALAVAIEKFEPDAVLVGHEVMGPFIASEACADSTTTYAAQLHGSALEYVVKRSAEFRDYAIKGLGEAHTVVAGSEYMVREASSVAPGWLEKARVVNPGCDVELFKPPEHRDPKSPLVGYVGKFIGQKGVHNLIAALGLTTSPGLRATIVGYGEWNDLLRRLWAAIISGDQSSVEAIANEGDQTFQPLRDLLLCGRLDRTYWERASDIDLEFTGRLEHGPLARVLPFFDILVVPSVMPEAFGMVAAEAAACGVLPIVPNHSGIGEVGGILESTLGQPGLLTFDSEDPINGIAAKIDRLLAIAPEARLEMGRRISELAHERWAWPTVARALLAAASPKT
jgi:glycosyltransferase involved in cell wall biosynthesis